MQADKDINNPALTQLPLQQVHIYFPVCYLDVALPKLAQPPYNMKPRPVAASPSSMVQSENYYFVLPEARMPDTPVLNEMYETGLLHPETAKKIWFIHSCSLKLPVTMFTPTELECSHQTLQLTASGSRSSFNFLDCTKHLATTLLDMGTIAQQQAARKVNIDQIRDSGNILRTDGCYCTTPRKDLARRLHHGEISGPLPNVNCTHPRHHCQCPATPYFSAIQNYKTLSTNQQAGCGALPHQRPQLRDLSPNLNHTSCPQQSGWKSFYFEALFLGPGGTP